MRLSTLGRYALRAMVDLAMHQDQGPVPRQEIADRQELSSNYLAQLFAKLGRAGLVKSVFGPGGGYVLAKSATEITAGDVLRAVEESLAPVFCVDCDQDEMCHRAEGCPTRPVWRRLGEQVTETLDSITVAELCEQPDTTDPTATEGPPAVWLAL
jgi:Rrf2 family cysteine metabolism transcriptional repressor